MKFKAVFLPLILAFSFSSVFAATDNATNQTNNQARQDAASIGWVIVVDKNEIMMSDEALKRKLNDDVKDYAEYLKKQHTENLKDALKLSEKIKERPLTSSETEATIKGGHKTAKSLSKLNDQQFQVTYINDMVVGHEQALNKLDQLIKTASNKDVKDFLEDTRKAVEKHLEKAKKIQEELKSQS
jgi:putative membrane protein